MESRREPVDSWMSGGDPGSDDDGQVLGIPDAKRMTADELSSVHYENRPLSAGRRRAS
jgi:hypothetical protein